MAIDQATINFAVYEDSVEYCGMTQITLPNISMLTTTVSGAGISGNYTAGVIGHIDAMTATFNWRTHTEHTMRLMQPGLHTVDLRAPVQDEDAANGTLVVRELKHVMVIEPITETGGTVAPATAVSGSTEFSVRRWETYIDDELVRKIDPRNMQYTVNGTDYLADVRSAMGKQ